MADDFYEDDEPKEDVVAAFDAGDKQLTEPPHGRRRHAVMVEQDWQFWTEEFAHRWRWPCAVAVWWNTRTPDSRWAGRNIEVRTVGDRPPPTGWVRPRGGGYSFGRRRDGTAQPPAGGAGIGNVPRAQAFADDLVGVETVHEYSADPAPHAFEVIRKRYPTATSTSASTPSTAPCSSRPSSSLRSSPPRGNGRSS